MLWRSNQTAIYKIVAGDRINSDKLALIKPRLPSMRIIIMFCLQYKLHMLSRPALSRLKNICECTCRWNYNIAGLEWEYCAVDLWEVWQKRLATICEWTEELHCTETINHTRSNRNWVILRWLLGITSCKNKYIVLFYYCSCVYFYYIIQIAFCLCNTRKISFIGYASKKQQLGGIACNRINASSAI